MKVVYITHPISGDIKGNLKKIEAMGRQINLEELENNTIDTKEEIDLHYQDEPKIIHLDSREEIYRRILDRK